MPDLNFEIIGTEPASRGLLPLLNFKLRITNGLPEEQIHALLLSAQIQFQPARRRYNGQEQERLSDLFGEP
jgi:hypothetical protein